MCGIPKPHVLQTAPPTPATPAPTPAVPPGLTNIAGAVEDVLVPDNLRIENVTGFRAWEIVEQGNLVYLQAMVKRGQFWRPKRWQRAECLVRSGDKEHAKSIPVESCSCGFYAAKTREHLKSLGYNHYSDPTKRVVGEVLMKGKVIICQTGYRAEYVTPYKFYIPHEAWRMAKNLERRYEVEVELSNLFK